MWQIGSYWINPQAITYIWDRDETSITVYFAANAEHASGSCMLTGQHTATLLTYLAQHTTMPTPYLVRDDSDEPPF